MPRMTFFVMLLCLAGVARAQTLYHCRAHGISSYQQSPCPASARMVSSIETIPEPALTESQQRALVKQGEQGRVESAFLSHSAGTDANPSSIPKRARRVSGPPHRSACQEARTARKVAIEAAGLDRTYAMLHNLDQSVAVACRRS
jgi:hypothetical protein